ncbi:NAD(P)/FAD-dependent oxidoreductase [Rhodothermus profundi]|uniref:Dehydrogenase (Flavoprotein) n=1 Tax=Rhodothermus profundi TaxID=633813 RepID=A0A1M6P9D2_9BACT|nr:NAD(P)/FAD-dependent oxidoreductase [Rhodothermus profundi]SHK04524.1 Dehydrogenase (flavoprotein) [Rhodothermus profundi]
MNTRADVQVIGAGPAGLTAAITLARAGVKVDVFEQAPDVGARFHGDFQGLENWSTDEDVLDFLAALGLETNFQCVPYTEGVFYDPSLEGFPIRTQRPWFYLITRGPHPGSLDQGLKQQALEAGAALHFRQRVERITGGPVIVATGPYAADAIARGLVFETDHPDACYGFLDDRIAPRGYAYLLVHRGRATLATCLFDDFPLARVYFERTLETVSRVVRMPVRNPRVFGGYVNFAVRDTWTRGNRVYFVGERAGFQDALWGFGLRYALWSGYLAARAILEQADYNAWCRQYLVPWLQTSLVNRLLYNQLGNHGYRWMLQHLSQSDVLQELRRQYQPSKFKQRLYRVARHRLFPTLREQACRETECTCLWCRHGKHVDHASLQQCVPPYLTAAF